MTVIGTTWRLVRGETRALAADRRGGAGFEFALIAMASTISAAEIGALSGASLQQSFDRLNDALAVLTGG